MSAIMISPSGKMKSPKTTTRLPILIRNFFLALNVTTTNPKIQLKLLLGKKKTNYHGLAISKKKKSIRQLILKSLTGVQLNIQN
jgi:hypothetical protein